MFKTTKGWTAGFLIASLALGGLMIVTSWLLKGTPYSDWTKEGFTVLWWVVFFGFVCFAPEGTCRFPWRRKTN